MAPLVGISTSELRTPPHVEPLAQSDPARRELALGLDYPRAIDEAGAIPVVIPPLAARDFDGLIERLDGLLLSGGPDLCPTLYGADPSPDLGPTDATLDAFELELLRRADAAGLPILAICRGLQALNVARGGTLHQHLPADVGGAIHHRQHQPGVIATHAVEVQPGSRLAVALGETSLDVNSFHHQAVRDLGRALEPVAWAPDGVIEALEATDRPFVVAVQWHAEGLGGRADQQALFGAFVEAAAQRSESHRIAA